MAVTPTSMLVPRPLPLSRPRSLPPLSRARIGDSRSLPVACCRRRAALPNSLLPSASLPAVFGAARRPTNLVLLDLDMTLVFTTFVDAATGEATDVRDRPLGPVRAAYAGAPPLLHFTVEYKPTPAARHPQELRVYVRPHAVDLLRALHARRGVLRFGVFTAASRPYAVAVFDALWSLAALPGRGHASVDAFLTRDDTTPLPSGAFLKLLAPVARRFGAPHVYLIDDDPLHGRPASNAGRVLQVARFEPFACGTKTKATKKEGEVAGSFGGEDGKPRHGGLVRGDEDDDDDMAGEEEEEEDTVLRDLRGILPFLIWTDDGSAA